MKKQLSFVIQISVNDTKNIALATSCSTNQNLYHVFDGYNNGEMGFKVKVVHYCETWKKALELEQAWNEGFKNNGTLWEGEF